MFGMAPFLFPSVSSILTSAPMTFTAFHDPMTPEGMLSTTWNTSPRWMANMPWSEPSQEKVLLGFYGLEIMISISNNYKRDQFTSIVIL